MLDEIIDKLESSSCDEAVPLLREFVIERADNTSIPELNDNHLRQRLWSSLFSLLNDQTLPPPVRLLLLTTVKIISRDKTDLQTLVTEDRLLILSKCGNLSNPENQSDTKSETCSCVIEAMKCLCNIIINNNHAAEILNRCNVMDALVRRITSHLDSKLAYNVKLFDLKLLFLMTALCNSTRVQLYQDLKGLQFFTNFLLDQLKDYQLSKRSSQGDKSDELYKICSEVLKIVFNMLVALKPDEPNSLCNDDELSALVNVLRELLMTDISQHLISLQSDVINLLTLVPSKQLEGLKIPGGAINENNIGASPGLLPISYITDFLDMMLTAAEESKESKEHPKELLPPVLLVLLHLAQSNKFFRKYIRSKVLPSLTRSEIFTRPEEGTTIRNKLCRLLTTSVTVKDLAADFLFVLCKENVGRMVKYTGYGNAAGLFARRGLMGKTLTYSSDSESENEEYNQHKHLINPIVGCRTPSHPDPIEKMSEEQKEFLAMELVNKIDRLQREGIIQTCKIGMDGRPEPIEHVQELQAQHAGSTKVENE